MWDIRHKICVSNFGRIQIEWISYAKQRSSLFSQHFSEWIEHLHRPPPADDFIYLGRHMLIAHPRFG